MSDKPLPITISGQYKGYTVRRAHSIFSVYLDPVAALDFTHVYIVGCRWCNQAGVNRVPACLLSAATTCSERQRQ